MLTSFIFLDKTTQRVKSSVNLLACSVGRTACSGGITFDALTCSQSELDSIFSRLLQGARPKCTKIMVGWASPSSQLLL